VSAQVQYCSSEDTCIAISIPENQKTVETSFFVSLQAPASAKWFAFGFGSQMAGSLILVAWPYNNEVIVSIRLATYSLLIGNV
jgi:Cytochrome domain of cellobiose dehydrogenase